MAAHGQRWDREEMMRSAVAAIVIVAAVCSGGCIRSTGTSHTEFPQVPVIPISKEDICTLKLRIRDSSAMATTGIVNADVLAATGASLPDRAKSVPLPVLTRARPWKQGDSVRLFMPTRARPVWKQGDIVSVRVYFDKLDHAPEWMLMEPWGGGFLRITQEKDSPNKRLQRNAEEPGVR